MEDKLFELMTKMYSEFTARFNTIDKKLDDKSDRQDIIRLENRIDNDSKALFDGYKQTFEKFTDIEKKLEDISDKVDKQDIEITLIKGGEEVCKILK